MSSCGEIVRRRALVQAAKVRALPEGGYNVGFEKVSGAAGTTRFEEVGHAGVLLMLGVGGVLVTTRYRRAADEATRARALERLAREEAERARLEAERARAQAEARLKEVKDQRDAANQKPAKKE
jgi:hypothetical protein